MDRAQRLSDAARGAVAALGSQAAVARTLGVSPRMIRHALSGTKGHNLEPLLRRLADGEPPSAVAPAASSVRRRTRSGAPARVRQPIRRVGPVSVLQGRGGLTAAQLALLRANRGGRASIRVDRPDGRTMTLYGKGGRHVDGLLADLEAGADVDDLLSGQYGGDVGAAGATFTVNVW